GRPKLALGFDRRESLIPVNNGNAGYFFQPTAEGARFRRLLTFTPTSVHGQTQNDLLNLFVLDQRLEMNGVSFTAAALVSLQGRSDLAIRISHSQSDSNLTIVHTQQARRRSHRYFSIPFFLSISTSCLTAPSSRRSATNVASSLWTMSKSLTPTVAIRWPVSA